MANKKIFYLFSISYHKKIKKMKVEGAAWGRLNVPIWDILLNIISNNS